MNILATLLLGARDHLGAGLLILALFPAAASAQSSTSPTLIAAADEPPASAAPGRAAALAPAPDSLAIGIYSRLTTAGSTVDQSSAGDTTTAAGSPQRATGAGTNPTVHTGQFYSGLLQQQILGLRPDAPITLGGIAVIGGNWLASGGLKPQTTTADFVLGVGAMADMERLLHIPGSSLYVSFLDYQGGKTNQVAGSMQIYDGLTPTNHFSRQEHYELWWQQRLFNDRLVVKIGKLQSNGEFLTQFCGPVLLPRSDNKPDLSSMGCYLPWGAWANPTLYGKLPFFPETVWGATIKFQPMINAYVKYGVFDGNGATGVETGLRTWPKINSYKFHIGEIGYSWLLGDEGKPGQFGAGVWGQTGALAGPDNILQNGATGFYAFASQRLWYQHPGIDPSGPIGWFQFGYTNSLTNLARRYVGVGVTTTVPGMVIPYDLVTVGLAWSKLNPGASSGSFFFPNVPASYLNSIALRSSELMMQAGYQLTLVPSLLALQATYTAIPTPGARPGIPWANAFTIRTTIIF